MLEYRILFLGAPRAANLLTTKVYPTGFDIYRYLKRNRFNAVTQCNELCLKPHSCLKGEGGAA